MSRASFPLCGNGQAACTRGGSEVTSQPQPHPFQCYFQNQGPPSPHPRAAANEFTVTYQFGVMHRLTHAYSAGANNIHSTFSPQGSPWRTLGLLHPSLSFRRHSPPPPPNPRPRAVELHNLMKPVSVQQTNEVHVYCIQWRVGQHVLERYCPQYDGWPLCHCLPVQQRGMFMVICTYLCTQSRTSSYLCAWVNHDGCPHSAKKKKKAGEPEKGRRGGKTTMGSPSDVECV